MLIKGALGGCFNLKMLFYQYHIHYKIRWSHDCLIFIMEIPIPGMMVFILKQVPGIIWVKKIHHHCNIESSVCPMLKACINSQPWFLCCHPLVTMLWFLMSHQFQLFHLLLSTCILMTIGIHLWIFWQTIDMTHYEKFNPLHRGCNCGEREAYSHLMPFCSE